MALHEIESLRQLAGSRFVVGLWEHFAEEIAGIEVQSRCSRAVAI